MDINITKPPTKKMYAYLRRDTESSDGVPQCWISLDTWVGNSVHGLVQHWGTPSDVNNLSNGSALYTWLFDDGIANSPINGSINAVTIYCKITVDVSKNETIQSWQIEGNDCKA